MNIVEIERIWEEHGVHEKLRAYYKKQIKENFYPDKLDFEETEEDDFGNIILCDYIGSVMNIFPSGKFYMPWTSNQTIRDVWKDRAFAEALEDVLDSYGMWFQSGEGDPTDLFVCTIKEKKDV